MSQPIRFCLLFVGDSIAPNSEAVQRVEERIVEAFRGYGWELAEQGTVPDNAVQLAETLRRWSDGRCDLLLTIGGTGFSPRESAPEATRQVLQREASGIMECVRIWGGRDAPALMLSRGLAGIRNRVLIINLPFGVDEVQAALKVLLPLLPRAIAELRDEPVPALPQNLFANWLGKAQASLSAEQGQEASPAVAILETNLDDFSPEFYETLMERLFTAGALDVYCTPIQMKKARPATLLTVLAPPEKKEELAKIIFSETTTFGIRHNVMERYVLARRWETVDTLYGPIRVKVGSWGGVDQTASPEYEDVRAAARAHGVPVKEVYLAAQFAYEASRRQKSP